LYKLLKISKYFAQLFKFLCFISRNNATTQRGKPLLFRATTQRRNGENLFCFAQRRNDATGKTSFVSRNDATTQRGKPLLFRAITQRHNEKKLSKKKLGISGHN